jgi:hypothetical protein
MIESPVHHAVLYTYTLASPFFAASCASYRALPRVVAIRSGEMSVASAQICVNCFVRHQRARSGDAT